MAVGDLVEHLHSRSNQCLTMLDKIKPNGLFALYLACFGLVSFGVVVETGTLYVHYLGIFLASILTFYSLFYLAFKRLGLGTLEVFTGLIKSKIAAKWLGIGMLILITILAVGHWTHLGQIPTLTALGSSDYYYIQNLRREITFIDNAFWRYGSSFLIRALMPFFLLWSFKTFSKKIFWIIAVLMVIYSVSLLPKSFVLIVLLPTIVYALLNKNYKSVISLSGMVIGSLAFLVVVANPGLRMDASELEQNSPYKVESVPSTATVDSTKSKLRLTTEVLARRIFIVPGYVVGKWFECVPDSLPFLNGCGYRFIAGPKGCEFHNYPHELWQYVHPDYHAVGRKGTVNTASFMYDYVNWGWKGLIISGVILGLVLAFIENLFAQSFVAKISINALAVFWLTSTSLFTLLLSGGWGLMIVLYAVFSKSFSDD